MPRQRKILLITALVGCVAAPLWLATDAPAAARITAALAFFCLAPGAAVLALVTRRAAQLELGLVIALSLSLLVVIAQAMLMIDAWQPERATYVLSAACLGLIVWHLLDVRATWSRSASTVRWYADARRVFASGRGSKAASGKGSPLAQGGVARRDRQSDVEGWLDLEVRSPQRLLEADYDLTGERTSVFVVDEVGNSAPTVRDGSAPAGRFTSGHVLGVGRKITRIAAMLRVVAIAVLLGAMALWLLALQGADLDRLSGYGLLTALPLTYYGALIALTLGFAVAMSEPVVAPKLLAAYAGALVIVLHGTTPLLYPEPRYTWVYKHFGVIDYISVHGTVDRAIDIYHNWPGFFALNAWFGNATEIAAIDYAAWAQVFFGLLNIAVLLFAVRAITGNVRLQWLTVWVFLVGNWVGQDYLAPQALSFPLVITVFGLCLRYALRTPRNETRFALRLRSRIDAFVRRLPRTPPEARHAHAEQLLSPRVAVIVGGVCFVAVVVSHQLSPVWLIFGLTSFALLTGRLPVWLIAGAAAVQLGWLALAWPYLSEHFALFDFKLSPVSRPMQENVGRALPGVEVVAQMSRGVVVAIGLLAVAGFVRWWRSGRFDLAALGFLLAPFPLIPLQSYGGEIIFRTYLFALPWLAFFAAVAIFPSTSPPAHRFFRFWRLPVITCLLGTVSLFAYFGLEKTNYVTEDDVALVRWYEKHAPNGSLMARAGHGVPDRLSADYARLRIYGDSYVPELSGMDELRQRRATPGDVPEIISYLEGAKARDIYVAITPSMENRARLYGTMPSGSMAALVRSFSKSPAFRLAYYHGDAYLFKLKRQRESARGFGDATAAAGTPCARGSLAFAGRTYRVHILRNAWVRVGGAFRKPDSGSRCNSALSYRLRAFPPQLALSLNGSSRRLLVRAGICTAADNESSLLRCLRTTHAVANGVGRS